MDRMQGKSARMLQVERFLLARNEPVTQAEVARHCGVNRSTINRMLADLSELGVPVYQDDRGRIAINRDAYLTDIRLTLDESMAVYLAARLLARYSDKPNPHVTEALLKLGLALEQGIAPRIGRHITRTSAALRERHAVAQPGYLRTLETLTKAWSSSYKVRMMYRPLRAGRPFEHVFAPYFLEPSAIGYGTYAIGLAEPPGKIRTRKVERIESVALTGEVFQIPPGFDPARLLAGAWGIWFDEDDQPTPVVLRFSGNVARRVRESRWHPSEQVEEDARTGDLLWRAEIDEWREIVPWVRQWGADVEALEPPELREALINETKRLSRTYQLAQTNQDNSTDRVLRLWGKTAKGNKDWSNFHPAVFHMLDIGNIARELLSNHISPRWRNTIAHALKADPETLADWLPYFVALHDIGKVSAAFQSLNIEQSSRLRREGFTLNNAYIPHAHITQIHLEGTLQKVFEGIPNKMPQVLSESLGGHHGRFAHPDEEIKSTRRKLNTEPEEWKSLRQSADAILQKELLKREIKSLSEPINISAAIMAITGFTILCDWLGSDECYFHPAPEMGLSEYAKLSRAHAAQSTRDSGLLTPVQSDVSSEVEKLLSDLGNLRPLQLAIGDIPEEILQSSSLTIIEAPTGEGKTEAALALTHRIAQLTGTDELYYALPTMATSNQMFERMQIHLEKRLGLTTAVKLVHGQAFLIEKDLRLEMPLASIQPLENGETKADSETNESVTWFNSKKRALIAPFGVGTIDQAELAALNVKHAALRMMGLVGKVVIVDEVHAYDTYMTTVIERLLRWLAAMNTSVILLSATLPISRRKRLADAYGAKIDLSDDQSKVYPSLLVMSEKSTYQSSPEVWQPNRTIVLHELHFGDDAVSEKAKWLLDSIADGGSVCWITNTVKRAQHIFDVLCNNAMSEVDLQLLHSQFPLDERQRREDDLKNKYGRDGKRPTKGIVVGTQVLEQSLDLDFDVMVSDLAPIDLLLQRTGRLHRHDRARPDAHATPHLWLNFEMTPKGNLKSGTDRTIYDEFIMLQTRETLIQRKQIQLPNDYRALIEAVYSDEQPSDGSPLATAWYNLIAKQIIATKEAKDRLLPEPHPRDSFAKSAAMKVNFEEDENSADWIVAKTRLGERTLNVIPLERDCNCAILTDTGDRITVRAEASRETQRRLLRRHLRISNQSAIDALEEAGKDTTELFTQSPLLKGFYPLWLTNGKKELKTKGGILRITLDPQLGLVIEKEDKANDTEE